LTVPPNQPPAAEQLAEFALRLSFADIPITVVDAAKEHLLDAVGCGLAAVALGEGAARRVVARASSGSPEASLIGASERCPAPSAALANGMLIHALDFDDTHAEAVSHVSAVVVPAALAAAECSGADGRALLAALVAGNEEVVRIGAAASGEFHARGFHPTSVAGVFGAAAAAARLEGADLDTTVSALGLAGSMASGLFAYLDDATATKPLHAGWAAHAGILAARLAAAGAEGPPHVLEGRFGLFEAFLSRVPDLADAAADLGSRWETLRIGYKPYPACHYSHGALGAAATLELDPEAIATVVARVAPGAVDVVLEPYAAKLEPRTPYDAKFSLQYALASMIVHRRVNIDTFTGAAIADPEVVEMAHRVRYEVGEFPSPFGGAIEVELRDGRVLRAELPHPAGSPENPLAGGDLRAKFQDNAGAALPPAQVEALEHAIGTLEQQADVRNIGRILSAASAPTNVTSPRSGFAATTRTPAA
jgi:2-methylcitrate dehydratase PrpD